jgi:hypothetical protein
MAPCSRLPLPILCALWLLLQGSVLYAQSQGGAAASYLRRSVLAQEIGMGGAFNPFAPDGSVIFSNSATLPLLKRPAVSASYSKLPLNQGFTLLGFGTGIGEFAGIGFGVMSYGISDVSRRNGGGQEFGTTGNKELALSVGGGLTIGPGSIGATVRYMRQDFTGTEAPSNGYAVDLSGTISFREQIFFAFSMNNIAGEMRATYDPGIHWQIPWDARLSGSYLLPLEEQTVPVRLDPSGIPSSRRVKPHTYLLGVIEGRTQLDSVTVVSLAVEAVPVVLAPGFDFGLRLGWNSRSDLSAGFLVQLPVGFTDQLRLDYAIRREFELGDITHHVSLTAGF